MSSALAVERAGSTLDRVLAPRSVAVIGASSDPRKRGYQVLVALRASGYAGEVYPVNPKGGELAGYTVHPELGALPEAPDLALVCTPAPTVPAVLEACAARGIAGAVVLAVGFGESGAEGAALEAAVREVARRTGIRVVGPNTSGLLNVSLSLNLIGMRDVCPGRLALLVQSGNMALSLVNEAAATPGAGISFCIGVGNGVDLDFADYLTWLDAHAGTAAVLMYAEGFRNGRAFFDAACKRRHATPIVLLKGGRSAPGERAARSHTGAVAGSYAVARAALRQAGIVEVTRSDELFAVGHTLASQPPVPAGRGIAILADGGGQGTLAADALGEAKVPLATLSTGTRDALRGLLGPAANVANPIDVAGAADAAPERFAEVLRLLYADDAVGGVIFVGLFGGYALRFSPDLAGPELDAARGLLDAQRAARRPFVLYSLYARAATAPLRFLQEGGVPVVGSIEVACRAMGAAVEQGRFIARRHADASDMSFTFDAARVERILAPARAEGRTALLETEARALLESFGGRSAPATLCQTAEDAARAAGTFNAPVALKIVAPGIPHKTEARGVRLDVRGPTAVAAAFDDIVAAAQAYLDARGAARDVRGVLVAPMLPSPCAELLIGARRDPQFGPVLTIGSGGTDVELLRDVAVRILPASRASILEALDETLAGARLRGLRGAPPADRDAVATLALAVARTLERVPRITEIEANPVFAYDDGAVAVDVRAFVADAAEPS